MSVDDGDQVVFKDCYTMDTGVVATIVTTPGGRFRIVNPISSANIHFEAGMTYHLDASLPCHHRWYVRARDRLLGREHQRWHKVTADIDGADLEALRDGGGA